MHHQATDSPQECTAETSTHVFAAADEGFSKSHNHYTGSYNKPFEPLTLSQGLNTKVFSGLLKNLTVLESSKIHLILLRAVAANGEIRVNLNDLLDMHHGASLDDAHPRPHGRSRLCRLLHQTHAARGHSSGADGGLYSTTSLAEAQVNIRRLENILEELRLLALEALEALH
jgi:hypothetical protein